MKVFDHYGKEKQRFLEHCTQCGVCAKICPILPLTGAAAISPPTIQKDLFDFMQGGAPNALAYTKAFACMACFKCTADICPEGLNPLLVNEIIKGAYINSGQANSLYRDIGAPDSTHRVLASAQLPAADFKRISSVDVRQRARYVFFPGCNVYFQPDKILNALDILDAIGDDYVFLPGLDHCCGDNHLFFGQYRWGSRLAQALVDAVAAYRPETLVLWCPTCQCRFEKYIGQAMDIPFTIRSFSQYLADRMDKLPLTGAAAGTVTLHEACKAAYTGVDRNSARKVLRQLPGVTLREMEHHGERAVCCGSGADCWFPESSARMRQGRLEEAAQTGAERMVTVCHYCSQAFVAEASRFEFTVVNYVQLVAEAMGIRREDRFGKYMLWRDLDRIWQDAAEYIAASPHPREKIAAVFEAVFMG